MTRHIRQLRKQIAELENHAADLSSDQYKLQRSPKTTSSTRSIPATAPAPRTAQYNILQITHSPSTHPVNNSAAAGDLANVAYIPSTSPVASQSSLLPAQLPHPPATAAHVNDKHSFPSLRPKTTGGLSEHKEAHSTAISYHPAFNTTITPHKQSARSVLQNRDSSVQLNQLLASITNRSSGTSSSLLTSPRSTSTLQQSDTRSTPLTATFRQYRVATAQT